MIESVGVIRHGEKINVGENRKPLEESGLTPEQQKIWKEAQEHLGLHDPEIAYEALPKIEAMAREMYSSLPDNALVMFNSTPVPRARMTVDLLATALTRLSMSDNRNISTAFIWEPQAEAEKTDSVSNIPMYPPEIVDAMEKKIAEMDTQDDDSLRAYLQSGNAAVTHPLEDEITLQIMNDDLSRPDSFMKRRAALLKEQITKLEGTFKTEGRPVFFYGVGHHSSLIAMDVAFNDRTKYNSVDEMPKPLSLWGTNNTKELH